MVAGAVIHLAEEIFQRRVGDDIAGVGGAASVRV